MDQDADFKRPEEKEDPKILQIQQARELAGQRKIFRENLDEKQKLFEQVELASKDESL